MLRSDVKEDSLEEENEKLNEENKILERRSEELEDVYEDSEEDDNVFQNKGELQKTQKANNQFETGHESNKGSYTLRNRRTIKPPDRYDSSSGYT